MGYTAYANRHRLDFLIRECELAGCEVIAKSGPWYLWRRADAEENDVRLTYFKNSVKDGWRYIKGIDVTSDPGVFPPKTLLHQYLEYYEGDLDVAGGLYGRALLEQALVAPSGAWLKPGVAFKVDNRPEDHTWSDLAPINGEYTWVGRFVATRNVDGAYVQLPRRWRKMWNPQPVLDQNN